MSNQTKPNIFDLKEFKSMFRNFIRCNRIIWVEKHWLVIGLLLISAAISLMPFLYSGSMALIINYLVDIVEGQLLDNTIYYLLALLVFANAAPRLIQSTQMHYIRLFWFYMERKFQLLILDKLAFLDIAAHENPKHQDLISRVNQGGIFRLQNFIDRQFYIMQNLLVLLIASSVLFYAEWWIMFIILLGTVPALINELKFGKRAWSIWDSTSEVRRRYSDLKWRYHHVSAVTEMKLFQNTKHFLGIIDDLFASFQNQEIANEKTKYRLEIMATLISQITLAVAVIYFVWQVIYGHIQIGTFTFVVAAIATFRGALSALFMNIAHQYQDNLFVQDTFDLLDLKAHLKQPRSGIQIDPSAAPQIEFKNISFKYPGTKDYVLKNFSITIQPGEKIAIIGVNGAGKTTLIKLLCRFYDVNKGQILINGHDIKDIDLDSWYNLVGALFQDYERYHFLVKETIALGRSQQSMAIDKVKQAAESSEANIFIENWQKQYDAMIGKMFTGGIEPSVGQWQKLSLARTFYRDPKVLILDEPTASIDAEAEAKIFDKLHKSSQNRTIILISHRFSTVRNADKICVIENGQLAEYGTHQELLENKSTYHRLFKLQAKGYQ